MRVATGIQWVSVMDVAKHYTMHRTALYNKELSRPNVSNVEAETCRHRANMRTLSMENYHTALAAVSLDLGVSCLPEPSQQICPAPGGFGPMEDTVSLKGEEVTVLGEAEVGVGPSC